MSYTTCGHHAVPVAIYQLVAAIFRLSGRAVAQSLEAKSAAGAQVEPAEPYCANRQRWSEGSHTDGQPA